MKGKSNIKYSWVFFTVAAFFCSVLLIFVLSVSVNAQESVIDTNVNEYTYTFVANNFSYVPTDTLNGTSTQTYIIKSDNPFKIVSFRYQFQTEYSDGRIGLRDLVTSYIVSESQANRGYTIDVSMDGGDTWDTRSCNNYITIDDTRFYYFGNYNIYLLIDNANGYYSTATTTLPYMNVTGQEQINEVLRRIAIDDWSAYEENGNLPEEIIPDWDSATENFPFSLNGFTADNGISASWNGAICETSPVITEQINSYQNTYVVVELGYAPISEKGHIVEIIRKKTFYKISDNGFYLDWSEVQNDNDMYYLSYMNVTPYYYMSDNTSGNLRRGESSIVYYTPEGELSYYSTVKNEVSNGVNSLRYGTKYQSDFYLTGVSINTNIMSDMVISWTGTTVPILVPDEDTLVTATYIVYGGDGTSKQQAIEYKTTTIQQGSLIVDYMEISNMCEEQGYIWDCEIWLSPCYVVDQVLYMGEPSVVNCNNGTITNVGNSGSGTIVEEDVTNLGNFDSDSLANYGKYAFSTLTGLVSAMGSLPSLYMVVFGFIPQIYLQVIGIILIICLVLRVLGR